MNAADEWNSPEIDTAESRRQRRIFHTALFLMLLMYAFNSKQTTPVQDIPTGNDGKENHDDETNMRFYDKVNEEDIEDFMGVLNQGFENQNDTDDVEPHVTGKSQSWDAWNMTGNYRGFWKDPLADPLADGTWKPQTLIPTGLQDSGEPYIQWEASGVSDLDMKEQQFVEGTNEEGGNLPPRTTGRDVFSQRKDVAILAQGVIFHKYNRVSAIAGLSATEVELVWDASAVHAEGSDNNYATEEKQDDVGTLGLVTLKPLPVAVWPVSAEKPEMYSSISLGVVGGSAAKHWKELHDPWRLFERNNNGKDCVFLLNLQNNVQTTSSARNPSAWTQTISGELSCINCKLNSIIEVKKRRVDFIALYPKAVHYSILASIICVLQVYFIAKQLRYSQTQAAAARISLLCISLQAVLDVFLSIAHLLVLFWHPLLLSFSSVAFLKLVIFCIFEMRYMILVSQAHFPQTFLDGRVMARRQMAAIHARLYASLTVILLLIWYMPSVIPVVLLGLHSFWIPQITWNAIQDTRRALHPIYLYGMSATRLFIPAYFYGCPDSIVRSIGFVNYSLEVGWWRTSVLVLWMGIQVMIMTVQDKCGPRFFIPKQFLPVKYDYHRPIPPSMMGEDATSRGEEDVQLISRGERRGSLTELSEGDLEAGISLECSICCAEVEPAHENYMITPCHHVYHPECLTRWMEIKLECPSCRASLPPE